MELKKVSVGNEMYFALQTMTIVQNEMDSGWWNANNMTCFSNSIIRVMISVHQA